MWVGKTRDSYLIKSIEDYRRRIEKFAPVELLELKPANIPNSIGQTRLKETQLILDNLDKKDCAILLTESGRSYDSIKFANWLSSLKISQRGRINFIIGGAYGVDLNVIEHAKLLSLSSMTFPHQLVRLILLEQIYRAFTIIAGHQYHH